MRVRDHVAPEHSLPIDMKSVWPLRSTRARGSPSTFGEAAPLVENKVASMEVVLEVAGAAAHEETVVVELVAAGKVECDQLCSSHCNRILAQ